MIRFIFKAMYEYITFPFRVLEYLIDNLIDLFIMEEYPIDFSLISDVEIEGVDTRDYPDFCDAFIARCEYMGREATDRELDLINENSDFVYDQVINYIF